MRVCARSRGQRSRLSLTTRPCVDKQETAFFTVREATFSLQTTHFFVGFSADNLVQREPQGTKVKAEKANFGVIKRYHCSFFTADSVNRAEGAGPPALWGTDWPFCGQTSTPSCEED